MRQNSNKIIKKWKLIASKNVFEHPRLTLVEDNVLLPNGKIIKYLRHAYKGNGGVIIICIRNNKLLLQQEYSYPVDEILYQFPGGRIEDGETHEEAAVREMEEESGLRIIDPIDVGWFYPDNRRTSAKLHVVFVNKIDIGNTGIKSIPDEGEFIKSSWVSRAKFDKMLQDGAITNYAVLSAWLLLATKRPELVQDFA